MFEAAFLHGHSSPLYNGDTCLIVFARNEHGGLGDACAYRHLSDGVTGPTDPRVEEALHDMGYTLSKGASGPCVIRDGAGWRMLVKPLL